MPIAIAPASRVATPRWASRLYPGSHGCRDDRDAPNGAPENLRTGHVSVQNGTLVSWKIIGKKTNDLKKKVVLY